MASICCETFPKTASGLPALLGAFLLMWKYLRVYLLAAVIWKCQAVSSSVIQWLEVFGSLWKSLEVNRKCSGSQKAVPCSQMQSGITS